jgi:hypothetical protein
MRVSLGMESMKAITLRNIPPHVARLIERKAREANTSWSRAVVLLLEERAPVKPVKKRRKGAVYTDLDFFFGSWTKQEADAFDADLAEQRKIDPELWN